MIRMRRPRETVYGRQDPAAPSGYLARFSLSPSHPLYIYPLAILGETHLYHSVPDNSKRLRFTIYYCRCTRPYAPATIVLSTKKNPYRLFWNRWSADDRNSLDTFRCSTVQKRICPKIIQNIELKIVVSIKKKKHKIPRS